MAPVAEQFLVDPAAHLVELLAGQLGHVERIGDLGRVGQHRVEHLAVGPGHVQGSVADLGTPGRVTFSQPEARRARIAAFHDIEQLPGPHVNDRGRPLLLAPHA